MTARTQNNTPTLPQIQTALAEPFTDPVRVGGELWTRACARKEERRLMGVGEFGGRGL